MNLLLGLGLLAAGVAMRFWLISTNVERKIASREAIITRTTNEGAQRGTPTAASGR